MSTMSGSRNLVLLAALCVLATAHECPDDRIVTSPGGVKYCDLRDAMTLKDCHEECQGMDHFALPCVGSAAENSFLKTRAGSAQHLWTGLYQTPGALGSTGGWDDTNWLSPGCTSSFRNWGASEPNDYFCVEENVAAISKDSGADAAWVDIAAKDQATCVCQEIAPGVTGLQDQFEDIIDRLEDYEVAPVCGGGDNTDEWFKGEVRTEDTIEPSTYTAPSGVEYYDTGKRGNFEMCFSSCHALGYSLPTPMTLEDSDFLSDIRGSTANGGRSATWLGLYQDRTKSAREGWHDDNWASLRSNSFRNWAHDEPNDYQCIDETCSITNLPEEHSRMWYDVPCAWEEPACICEQTPWLDGNSKKGTKFVARTLEKLMKNHERNTCFEWGEHSWVVGFWAMTGALSLSVLLNIAILIGCCLCFCCRNKQRCGAPQNCHPNVTYGVTPVAVVGVGAQQQAQARAVNNSFGDLVFPIANVPTAASPPPYSASAPPNSAPAEPVKPKQWANGSENATSMCGRKEERGAGGYPKIGLSSRHDEKV